ncbi:hypothetical protein NCLIV_022390 [Neospora caninum Liverpool]|nr:hypothetical protein NCLIV_022390 [Neospora caninum Liverpool]CBZ52450.1 hypothetical protein NCLIV_022390 [Neospora caninum Liverpool]|eukprot:XP_003882482.1 hypothetical protein NCLIV_022390 [Neospora caninum Liverpool]
MAATSLSCPVEPPEDDSLCAPRRSSRSASPAPRPSEDLPPQFPLSRSFDACRLAVCGCRAVDCPVRVFRDCAVHSSAPSVKEKGAACAAERELGSSVSNPPGSAGTNPTNSSRFTRVKTVSFATLSECGSVKGSHRSESMSDAEAERTQPSLLATRARSAVSPSARSLNDRRERQGTSRSWTSLPYRPTARAGRVAERRGSASSLVGRDSSAGGTERRSRRESDWPSSFTSRRTSGHSRQSPRGEGASWTAPGAGGGNMETPETPFGGRALSRCQPRCVAARRKIFRAFRNLAEHDLVFRMKEDLASMRHENSMRSVFADTTRERSGADVSERGRLSAGTRHFSVATSLHKEGSDKERSRDGGASPNTNLSRSGSGDPILRRFPLRFVDKSLEDLFAANINRWMVTRLLLMGILSLFVTSMMWPLMAWSFNLLDAFNHNEPLGVLFHINMAVTVSVAALFIVTKLFRRLARHAELVADGGTFLVVTIWGVWNTTASYILEHSYVQDVIGSAGIPGQPTDVSVSLEKTSAWSTSLEASSAVAYLYGLLLIVQLDVVYPSRTRRTWQVHLMFFGFSAGSIVIRGALNPDFVPVPFVVIRVLTYLMLTVFLFIGRHATELQQRQTFYNWLTTRKRVDRLESDLKRQREKVKVSTAVEQLVNMVKHCMESCHSLESEVGAEMHAEHRSLLVDCHQTLSRCLSILTNTSNLYTVQFGDLDSDAHRDIIQAFLNNHNSSPADWTRVTTAAYTRGVDDGCWTASGDSSEEKNAFEVNATSSHAEPSACAGTLGLVRSGSAGAWHSGPGLQAWPSQSHWTGTLDGVHLHPCVHAVAVSEGRPAGARGRGDASAEASSADALDRVGVSPHGPPAGLTCLDEGCGEERESESDSTDGDRAPKRFATLAATKRFGNLTASKRRAGGRKNDRAEADEREVELQDNGLKPAAEARGSREKKLGLTAKVLHDHLARLHVTSPKEGDGKRERRGESAPCSPPSQSLTPQSLAEFQARLRYETLLKIVSAASRTDELSVSPFAVSEEAVRDWSFDCLRHAQVSPTPLVDVGYVLLQCTSDDLRLPSGDVLLRFLTAVEVQYNHVPYHNCIHGLMVAQKMVALTELLELSETMNSRDRALIVVAGLCHDIGHPGRNNALFINALDPVAVLYNDKSVLENYHSCLTFKTLELPDCDIFFSLRTKDYHVVRSLIIDLILATDMKNHFETVSRFRVRRNALDFDLSGDEDFWFTVKMIMKCADLAHCSVSWSQHFQWCQRLSVEFYDQGDEEMARHLPMSPLCDREKHSEVAKSQLGFMNFVAVPLFEELSAVDNTGNIERECIAVMKTNASHWEALSFAAVPVPLLGQPASPNVQPPLLHLIDGSGGAAVRPGSKAAEIACRYSPSTVTALDLSCLVYKTQLNRARRGSQQSGRRVSEVAST